MKKQTNIILIFLFITNLNIFAQANKLVTTTQKVMAEKTIQEYCKYVEEVAHGNINKSLILLRDNIEQFANETWDDIENNKLISFDKYFQKLQSKKPKIHFTKIPTISDFLYYTIERKDINDSIIKVPFIAAPLEKTINGKRVKGYIFVRAMTNKIITYFEHLPDWALIVNEKGEKIDNKTSTQNTVNANKIILTPEEKEMLKQQIIGIINDFQSYLEFISSKKRNKGDKDINSKLVLSLFINKGKEVYMEEPYLNRKKPKLIEMPKYLKRLINLPYAKVIMKSVKSSTVSD